MNDWEERFKRMFVGEDGDLLWDFDADKPLVNVREVKDFVASERRKAVEEALEMMMLEPKHKTRFEVVGEGMFRSEVDHASGDKYDTAVLDLWARKAEILKKFE